MKRSMMGRIVGLALVGVLVLAGLIGCNGGKDKETAAYDADQLFVKTTTEYEANENILYYRHPDGSETEIANLGFHLPPVVVIGNNIYYTKNADLYAVDFEGNEIGFLDGAETVFRKIVSKDDEWLYCHGSIPQSAMDVYVPIYTKVKADLSETHEITIKELPKLPAEYDRQALYEGILAEVGAYLDLIGVDSAGVLVEPNGLFSEMALDIWAYDSTTDGVDKWITGKALVANSVLYGFDFWFNKDGEETTAFYENPIMLRELVSLEGFTVNLESLYNAGLIESNAKGDPSHVRIMFKDEKYQQYITKNVAAVTWFDLTGEEPEKLEVTTLGAPKLVEIMDEHDYFIIAPQYPTETNTNNKIAFHYDGYYSANLMVVFIPRW